ncbi:CDP-alcohol phosphatidyltransferase family protein [Cryobacterium tepidiphilum]|uniref:CDP-alcohol phosphatidyltransferase family protein n=1 Tax=Cryobacterium tepidiphilum TaxID=2486026 RepID=A0A3M8L480_9MICO|nr:CDP-alcohol phosphatidyltransferase family protein [Cryobacterium tepidiphilum]
MLTVPNVLSVFRLLLIPVFLVLLVQGHDAAALLVIAVASVTDFLDGFLARRLGQITRLGQVLDPAADRLYLFAALLGLAWREVVPWWFVIIVVARDVFMLALGILLTSEGSGPLPVRRIGKVATFCLFFWLPLVMLAYAAPVVAWAEPLGWVFGVVGAVLYWWAGIIYAVETARVIRTRRGALGITSDTLDH